MEKEVRMAIFKLELHRGKRLPEKQRQSVLYFLEECSCKEDFVLGLMYVVSRRTLLYKYIKQELSDFEQIWLRYRRKIKEGENNYIANLSNRSKEEWIESLSWQGWILEFKCLRYLPIKANFRLQDRWNMIYEGDPDVVCDTLGVKMERFIGLCLKEGRGELPNYGLRRVFTKKLAKQLRKELMEKCGDLSDVY